MTSTTAPIPENPFLTALGAVDRLVWCLEAGDLTVLKRDAWYEFSDDGYVLALDRWSSDRETLVTALFDTGWFETIGAAMRAASAAEFQHLWKRMLAVEDDDGNDIEYVLASATARAPGAEQITLVDVEEFVDGDT